MILYVSSSANVSLLDNLALEQELPLKKMTGQFSLLAFVIKDIRHFQHIRYLVIDRKAILETDAEMIQALSTLQAMSNMRVIILAEGLPSSSPFLQHLIDLGITNIATASSIDDLLQELRECLSEDGMQQYVQFFVLDETTDMQDSSPTNEEKLEFNCINVRIAIAGSDRRVGVTTTAMNLMYWIQAQGGSACYIEAHKSNHLAHIVQLFGAEQEENAWVLNGADCYNTSTLRKDYNFIILDCGVLGSPQIQEEFVQADIRLLCGSAMPYELPVFYRAMNRCKDFDVQAIGMFVPEDLKQYVQQAASKEIMFIHSSHDLFTETVNDLIYYEILKHFG